MVIGRQGGEADWKLPDDGKNVSKRHCLLELNADGLGVTDHGSKNGTYVNDSDQRLAKDQRHPLADGDRLRIGHYEIEVQLFTSFVSEPPISSTDGPGWDGGVSLPPEGDTEPYTSAPVTGPIDDDWLKKNFGSQSSISDDDPPEPGPRPKPESDPRPSGKSPNENMEDGAALLSAFMAGAGLPDERPRNPAAAMHEAGAAFRAFVVGLRQLLMARDVVKSSLGVNQTTFGRSDNNPLKFAAGDEDALTALLGTGRRTDMTPRQAVEDALRSLRRHEQASLPAMQAAVRALLERLRPDVLTAQVEAAEGPLPTALMFGLQRRARAWEVFEAEYKRIAGALDDDFDAVLGRRFSREYARIVDELRAAEEDRR